MAKDYAYSGHIVLSYLTLTAGDKGIKCPSGSPATVPRWTVRGASVCHDGDPVSVACHRTPQAARRPATCLWESPRATRGQVSWSAGLRWWLAAASGFAPAAAFPPPGASAPPGLPRGGGGRRGVFLEWP